MKDKIKEANMEQMLFGLTIYIVASIYMAKGLWFQNLDTFGMGFIMYVVGQIYSHQFK